MREDYYTNTEADAGSYERGRGDVDHYETDGYDEAAEQGYGAGAPRVTGNPLVNAVNSALVWSAALPGRWVPEDIAQTAPGVVAFTLLPGDDPAKVDEVLAREGFETMVAEGRLFIRRAVAGAA